MAMNFANGVQFWSIKDNTPANGDRLTDAAGNEISIGGGGGGVQNYDLFELNGKMITSDDCFNYNSQPSASGGREASAGFGNSYVISLTAGATYNAELTYEGEKLTGSGTATENSFTHAVNLTISIGDGSKSIQFSGSGNGVQVQFNGFGTEMEYGFVQAATEGEAVATLAGTIAALGLKITEA